MSTRQDLLDNVPPQNQEAERCVLGSMLRQNNTIDEVLQILSKEDFYSDANQKIFETMVALNDQGGRAIDPVILHDVLVQREWLADVGGAAYIAELWEGVPSAANVEYYARIVREKSLLRNLILASNEVLGDAYKQTMPADQLIESAQRKMFDLAEKGLTSHLTTLQSAIKETYDRIDERNRRGNAFSGLPTGFTDLNELTAGLQDSELVIIAARPSVGKCLSADSEIVLEDGSVVTIEEVYRRRQARLLTLGDDLKLGWAEPSAFVDDGHKPVYRVTTRLGRTVEATAAHPFLTVAGWRPLAEVKAGERIAVPRVLPVFGTETLRECEVKLLGYLIGDGGLTDKPEFTNGNPRLREDFADAVRRFGSLKVREENLDGQRTATLLVSADTNEAVEARLAFAARVRPLIAARFATRKAFADAVGVGETMPHHWWSGTCAPSEEVLSRIAAAVERPVGELVPGGWAELAGKNTLTRWLRDLGLWGKGARDKFVPDVIFRLGREQVALFLNRLLATDGWATLLTEGGTQIGYATVSKRLIRQIQHLLLRFGIISSLRRREVKYRGSLRTAWQLDITDQKAIRAFAFEIGMFGKESALERVAEAAGRKRYQTNRDLIPMAIWDRLDEVRGEESWASLARRSFGEGGALKVRRRCPSRQRLGRLAVALGDEKLRDLADSDVYWDEIVSIEPLGPRQVYDLTVPGTHNFVANDVCVHNTAFSLSLARNVITQERAPVFFVSLEQSRVEIAERLLCSHARVDSHRLRKGTLTAEDMEKLIEAGSELSNSRLFIDDTPAQGMLRIAANARRLKRANGIRLVIIDYLQLIEPENRRDPRQEQVAQISRRLKFLARELKIPVVALAQVNRASEDRQDHRPRLSDLRESGCLAGETLITLADTGKRVPIRELAGRSGFAVWALDERTMKLTRAVVSNAFSTGRKPVFRLRTKLGRTIRATANHRFRTFEGWRRLDGLEVGQPLAIPDGLPCLENRQPTFAQASWDQIASIEPDGEEEVFDLTVPGPANFVANDIIAHNSIEQDADTVFMLHRPDRYEPGQHEGIIEVIVAKNRNGPVGEVTLAYIKQYLRYEDFKVGTPFDG